MKIGIKQRLFLAILAASVLSVISMFMVLQWSLDRGFLRYANSLEQSRLASLVEALEKSYAREGSWDFLKQVPGSWHSLIAASQADIEPGPPAPSRRNRCYRPSGERSGSSAAAAEHGTRLCQQGLPA